MSFTDQGQARASEGAYSGGVPAWKRTLDILLIVISSPLTVPLGFLLACVIKLVSPGPVLFKQERVGHLGKRFMILKLRTMHVGADTRVHKGHLEQLMRSSRPMVKLDAKGDPRLIPFGVLLRSFGLDELPQLINVLRGEMSLVGPRPCIVYEYEQFSPEHRHRCDTLPGLTGLWQVNGKNRTTFEQMMAYDLQYAREKSLLLDLSIIARTIPALIRQAWDVKVLKRKLQATPEIGQPSAVHTP